MRVNLIHFILIFFKKNVKTINTLKKKKRISREQCNSRTIHMLHCSVNSGVCLPCSLNSGHMPPLFSEQWRHDTLFTEQCIMVEFSVQEKQHFSAFYLPAFRMQFIVGSCTVSSFFLLAKRLLPAFLKKRNL